MANEIIAVSEDTLEQHVVTAFRKVGASEDSLQAATRAMMHASRVVVVSHGVRLTRHYCALLEVVWL
ncbi:MAG: Ldh family oxidoreductase, partial [Devosia sp.]|nr:Ldh family oxidoreductase [Devosia sp.]